MEINESMRRHSGLKSSSLQAIRSQESGVCQVSPGNSIPNFEADLLKLCQLLGKKSIELTTKNRTEMLTEIKELFANNPTLREDTSEDGIAIREAFKRVLIAEQAETGKVTVNSRNLTHEALSELVKQVAAAKIDGLILQVNLLGLDTRSSSLSAIIAKVFNGIDDGNLSLALNLSGRYDVTHEVLVEVAKLTNLTQLDLSYCEGITDSALAALELCPELRILSLRWCVTVSDKGVKSISKLKKLEILDLSSSGYLTDRSLKSLGELAELKYLNLASCSKHRRTRQTLPSAFTNQGLKGLTKLSKLSYLNLRGFRKPLINHTLT